MKKGDKVEITGQATTRGGKEVIEGTATLIKIAYKDKYNPSWMVHFDGDAKDENYNRCESQMELITS
ncbi:hypothetical protein LCGC14_2117420 [marine sediment metagenome]|uniref:Uncharacterized protein n=1 Tax=marine sediment metagenome TaxID=412755 RepID=A0A0F9GIA6_9ZZZZ